jgi:DNA modification methylase
MEIKTVKLSEIKSNPNNPRIIKDDKFSKLVKSIQEFPKMLEIRPIVVNADMIVLGGNMRLKACKEAGLKEVPVIFADDLSEDEQKEFIIKDNVGFGEWDWDMIANEWDSDQIQEWGLDIPEFSIKEELEAEEDDYEMPDEVQTDIVLGDLFEIGEHRLLCGDSTCSDTVAKLMNGKNWNLMATSPPYNQGNSCGNLLHTKGLGTGKKDVKLYEDKKTDNRTAEDYFSFCIDILNTSFLFKNNEDHAVCWNVAYNAKSRNDYGKIIFSDENPFDVKETIIWDKTHSINLPQIGIYSRRCEFVFVMSSNEKYHTSQTYNDCRWNYWQIKSAGSQITGEDVEHRAAYPVEFASKMVNDFSLENDLIYEPFTGSGTTMVAAHQFNRKCYGMELDPKYCQMIVERMKKLDPSLIILKNGIAL